MFCKILNLVLLALAWTCSLRGLNTASYTDDTILELVAKFVPENPVILEAGANYGEDTNKMKRMWPKGTIHSFEPNPESFIYLRNNTWNLSNLHLYPIALSDHAGECVFHICKTNAGSSSLFELPDWRKNHVDDAEPIHVPCDTIDNWAHKNLVSHVDFMWLDLEGAELKVLNSAGNLLNGVKAIFLEVNFQEFRIGMVQYQEICQFLNSHGFEQIYITPMSEYINQANALFVNQTLL